MAFGVDSADPATTMTNNSGQQYGYCSNNQFVSGNLADSVAHNLGGVSFWGRYFGKSVSGSFFTVNEEGTSVLQAECDAMTSHGTHFILPLHSPGNTGGSGCDGLAAGKIACDGIVSAVQQSNGKIVQPGYTHQVFVYLDVEQSATLAPDYWNGWASTVANYAYNGTVPFFPCCYCDPDPKNSNNPCPVFCNSNNSTAYAIWSNQPEPGPCVGAAPVWSKFTTPTGCKCSPSTPPPTAIWQYIEAPACHSVFRCQQGVYAPYPNVDRDQSTPFFDATAYMLYLP